MAFTLQARLDKKTERTLSRLRKRTGLGDSELARRGIEALAKEIEGGGPALIGIGKHDSGIADLATNPRHMRGFGE